MAHHHHDLPLLEFYRQKIAEYDGEHTELLTKLERCKTSYEDQHKQVFVLGLTTLVTAGGHSIHFHFPFVCVQEWALAQRDAEIKELQKGLSDMQIYLLQERENGVLQCGAVFFFFGGGPT